jgi:outer membrane protein TolC
MLALAPASGAARADEAAVESLSVARCVALARGAAPEVRALAAERAAAHFDSAATALNGRPHLSIFGGALVAPQNSYDPIVTNLGEYHLKAGLDVPLADAGERRRARAQTGLAAESAAAESDQAAREAGLAAAQAALEIVRRREEARADRDALEWLERLANLLQSGVRSGERQRSDAVRVLLERDGVQAALESAEEARAALGRGLAELIARRGAGFDVAEPEAGDEAAPAETDSLALLAAIERAPEVRTARLAAAGERLALDEARSRNALRVDFSADAGLWGSDLTRVIPPDLRATHPNATFADRLRRDLGASVTFEFRRPVLDPSVGLAIRGREAAADAARVRADAASERRRREALDLMGRWRSATRRRMLAEASVARAEEHLLRMRSLYTGGATTLLELLDARQQLDDARARLADARLDCREAHWEGELLR